MNFAGIDLHKKTITVAVMNEERRVLHRRTFFCVETEKIREFFATLQPFQAVMEATASYEWLWELLNPLAKRLVLANTNKLRIIAESKNKSDKLDAYVLAYFLVLDIIPPAYRPTPRQREHRSLVRHRQYLARRSTAVRNKIRRVLSNYNADRSDLFSAEGLVYLANLTLSKSDRFIVNQLLAEWTHCLNELKAVKHRLQAFAKGASQVEQEAREVLRSIPGVGEVTVDVVISELGDVERFRSAKCVSAYAGLAPGQRESAGHRHELGITKRGSALLRWVLVEAAWRMVRSSKRWGAIFAALHKRRGKKKAIVAIARRLLTVMVALLRSGQRYRFVG